MTFLFDENLSPKLPRVLEVLEISAMHVLDIYPKGTEDAVWLERAAREGWVAVTADYKAKGQPSTAQLFHDSRVSVLFLRGALVHRSPKELLIWLLKHWDAIENLIEKSNQGTCFEGRVSGGVKRL